MVSARSSARMALGRVERIERDFATVGMVPLIENDTTNDRAEVLV